MTLFSREELDAIADKAVTQAHDTSDAQESALLKAMADAAGDLAKTAKYTVTTMGNM